MPTKRTFKVPPGLSTASLSNFLQSTTSTTDNPASRNNLQTVPSHITNNNLQTASDNTTLTMAAKTTECALIGAKLLHKGENQHQVLGEYQLLTITEEAKMKGWFDCSRTDGEVVKARHTGKDTKILHENDDKTKGIISYQYDVYSRRKEGANKKQEMMDSFLDSFVEDKNGTLYKVKFTKSRRGNAYTIHSTDEVVVLDGYGDGATKSTVTNKEQDKVVAKKENDGDDVMETEKSAGDEGKEVAAVSSSKSEADSMPPAGLDLLAEAVESRENGDANEKSGDYDSDATIALVSSSSSEETEKEKQAAAGLDALLSGKNGKNRRKRQEVETAPVAEGKGDKAKEFILDESTKQDVNAYIETCKEGRSTLFEKATASIMDDQLNDKKEKLEKDLASTKHDMSLVTSGVFKQYGEQTLLDTTQQLKEVDAQLDAEQEQIRNKKESIQAAILKEMKRNAM